MLQGFVVIVIVCSCSFCLIVAIVAVKDCNKIKIPVEKKVLLNVGMMCRDNMVGNRRNLKELKYILNEDFEINIFL